MPPRVVEPELLDSLPPNDPAAVRSRADLRRVNGWMRNRSHVAQAILSLPFSPASILEIGAGDGTFMLGVARHLARAGRAPVRLTLLDMEPVVSRDTLAEFQKLGWDVTILHQNLNDWISAAKPVELIAANLFLHHFKNDPLIRFFESFSHVTSAFIACEPRRWRPALIGCRLLRLIGCNYVTRHDALISVRAGFRADELSKLWPRESGFTLCELPAGLASHLFKAVLPPR